MTKEYSVTARLEFKDLNPETVTRFYLATNIAEAYSKLEKHIEKEYPSTQKINLLMGYEV